MTGVPFMSQVRGLTIGPQSPAVLVSKKVISAGDVVQPPPSVVVPPALGSSMLPSPRTPPVPLPSSGGGSLSRRPASSPIS